jgi:NAD(P)-dependent dehydrogenase (short-subunit alcohol dehydrogenase family)
VTIPLPFRADGLVAAITGGAQGIGLAAGRLLVAMGARVVLMDLDGAAAADAARGIGSAARGCTLDVTDEASVRAAFGDVVEREGRLDILVNNAGRAIRRTSLELDLADWDAVVAVNMTGAFLCARAAAAAMQAGRVVPSSTRPRSWGCRAAGFTRTSPIRRPRARW